jgi:hypothetical protein
MRSRLPATHSGLVALAPAAAAAPPPFGHACAPREGALYCPTASDAARVPTFDGVPLDADVHLPPSGDCARGWLHLADQRFGTFSVDVSRLRVVMPTRERQPPR